MADALTELSYLRVFLKTCPACRSTRLSPCGIQHVLWHSPTGRGFTVSSGLGDFHPLPFVMPTALGLPHPRTGPTTAWGSPSPGWIEPGGSVPTATPLDLLVPPDELPPLAGEPDSQAQAEGRLTTTRPGWATCGLHERTRLSPEKERGRGPGTGLPSAGLLQHFL